MTTEAEGAGIDPIWDEFCDSLREAGRMISQAPGEMTELDRAEGLRFLSRLVGLGLDIFLENGDPAHPELTRIMTPTRKFGIDNPDTIYHFAPITGSSAYRVCGNRGDVHYLAFTVYTGSAKNMLGGRTVANVTDADINFDPDGSFELYLAPDGHPALADCTNSVVLDSESATLAIRQYFLDIENDRPADLEIEMIDGARAPDPVTLDQIAEGMRGGSALVRVLSSFMPRALERIQEKPNTLAHYGGERAGNVFAAPDNDYLLGYFKLGPDEALIIEGQPPDARYWSLQLCNIWAESLDYRNFRVSLNHSQVALGDDGSFRFVISDADPGPGEPNWVDTAGHTEGLMAFRWLVATDVPVPECRVVKFAELQGIWTKI